MNKALEKWRKRKLRADNISVIVVYFDKEKESKESSDGESIDTSEEVINDDEDESREETPVESKVEGVVRPTLVRQNAGRWKDLESLARSLNVSVSMFRNGENSKDDGVQESSDMSADTLPKEDEITNSLKRKSTENNNTDCKRNRTESPAESPGESQGEFNELSLKTNVSRESIQALNLDE